MVNPLLGFDFLEKIQLLFTSHENLLHFTNSEIKGKKKKQDQNEDGTLSAETLSWLLKETSYTEGEVRRWFFNFMEECPSGKLSKAHLQRLFKRVFPVGDSENFCDYIFRLFDDDGNNVLEFKEFLQVNI